MVTQETLEIQTQGRGFIEVTEQVMRIASASGIRTGLCHVFLRHTSASLLITENADPEVRRDLERYLARLVPDGDPLFRHTEEGPDDMPSHVRNLLSGYQLSIPVSEGRLALGTWQGIYLWEHRHQPHRRQVVVTVNGER